MLFFNQLPSNGIYWQKHNHVKDYLNDVYNMHGLSRAEVNEKVMMTIVDEFLLHPFKGKGGIKATLTLKYLCRVSAVRKNQKISIKVYHFTLNSLFLIL